MKDVNKGRMGILLLDAGLLAFGVAAKYLAAAMIRWLPDCIFARRGITCPACGATRCVRALFGGNWAKAFGLHPFLFCLCFYLAAALLLLNVGYLIPQSHCKKAGKAMVGIRATIILTVLYALFGIIRMLLTLPG